jgi:hypothetical protein
LESIKVISVKTVATLPLEFYEAQKRENVVQFTNAA